MRRVLRFAGLTICILIAAAWAANYKWNCVYVLRVGGHVPAIGISCGVVVVGLQSPTLTPVTGWFITRNAFGNLYWWPQLVRGNFGHTEFWIPFWMLFFVVAMPTLWLWWLDRKPSRAGHCARCGYDLAGLAPAACPECGSGTGLNQGAVSPPASERGVPRS